MYFSTPLRLLLIVFLAVVLAAPLRANDKPPWDDWQSTLLKEHPLTGKIWSTRDERFVTPEVVAKAVADARFVLLGEVHDNADHHRLQAWLIEKAANDRKPAVVMEMISRAEATALRDYLDQPQADAAGLGDAVKWNARGWPDWRIYQPIAETSLRLKLPLHAGDIDRPTLRKVGRGGMDKLDADVRTSLLLDTPLGAALEEALLDELFDSHCRLMPRGAMGGMLHVQRLRDAVLADSVISAAGNGSAILIAGNGHVQADRAVPWYLTRRAPDAGIVTVMLLEADQAAKVPKDLIPKSPEAKPVADFIWFTPRVDREDPCEQLRKRFGKPK